MIEFVNRSSTARPLLVSPEQTRAKRPYRLSEEIAAEITDQIVRGVYPPGTALPNETRLCEIFGVSRPVIREALKVIEQKGLVRIRQGEGTTALAREEWNLLDPDVLRNSLENQGSSTLREDVVALRRDLEMNMVRRATLRLTPADLEELKGLLETMDTVSDPQLLHLADSRFHSLIHQASGNDIARTIVLLLVTEVTTAGSLNPGRDVYGDSNLSHRNVYERLVAGDSEGAAQAMGEHIAQRWFLSNREYDELS